VRPKTDRDSESEYVMLLPAGFAALAAFQAGEPCDHVVIDAAVCGNEMRFINARTGIADDPNCEFAPLVLRAGEGAAGAPEELAMAVRATRHIEPGEELLADYGDEYLLD
jgi:SET domain-containing protein